MKNKKAVSPIIATVLLVMVVLIIAIIILLWARSFMEETLLKEVKGTSKRVEQFCSELSLNPILNDDGSFGFRNSGNIPIYAYILKLTEGGSSDEYRQTGPIDAGYLVMVSGYNYYDSSGKDNYEEVRIIPILLGKDENGGVQEYTCSEDEGLVI